MTSGDEAGALTDSEGRADPETDARDVPAPAEPDPAAQDSATPDPATPDPGGAASGELAADDDEDVVGDDGHDIADDYAEDVVGDDGHDIADDYAEDEDEDEEAGRPASAGIWAFSVAVLCALLIAGLVTAGIFWNRADQANAVGDGQQAAIAVARTGVADLLTADYQNPGAWSAKLKPLAAGQFLSVVGNSASGFTTILAQGKVQTTGKVVNVGVEKYSGTTAQLAVLAYETVKNTQTPTGSERAYRMTVSMIQSGSKWLVSNVEFVQ